MCEDMDWKKINKGDSTGQKKSRKATLLRKLKDIGVIQSNKENAETVQVKQASVEGLTGTWYQGLSYYFQAH